MDIGPVKRVGPTMALKTDWGTYPTPYFNVPSADNSRIVQYLPPELRGRHRYRTQPRSVSNLPVDPVTRGPADALLRGRSSMVPGDTVAHGVGCGCVGATDPQAETKTSLYIFLGVLGLALVAFGGKK